MWKWLDRFNAAVSAAINLKYVVGAAAAVLAAVWAWAEQWGWFPLLLGAGIAFTSALWGWNGVIWRRQNALSRKSPEKVEEHHPLGPRKNFRDQDINILDHVDKKRRISNMSFMDCHICGPATLWPVSSSFRGCRFDGTMETVLVRTVSKDPPEGCVIVENTLFSDCQFVQVSLAYDDDSYDGAIKALAGPAPLGPRPRPD